MDFWPKVIFGFQRLGKVEKKRKQREKTVFWEIIYNFQI
jgi:hypothetical protein